MKLLARHPPVRLLPIWTGGVTAVGEPPTPPTQGVAPPPTPTAATSKPSAPTGGVAPSHARLIAGEAGAGAAFGTAAIALVGRTRQRRCGLRPRSAPQASPATAARPWYASGRSGFP
jgi:hypothetical protein